MDPRAKPLAQEAVADKIYSLVHDLSNSKEIRRGANEATKLLNKGKVELIVIAADVEPLEIVMHLPVLCEDKDVPYVFIPEKGALGRACNLSKEVAACAVLRSENKQTSERISNIVKEVERMHYTN